MALNTRLWNAQTTTFSGSGNANKVIVVGGRVRGLANLAGATQSNALYKVLDALASEGITLYPFGSTYPDDGSLSLTNILIRGLSNDAAEVSLRYETPTGFPGTALIYELDSSLQSVERDKFPGSQQPIWVAWQGRTTDGGAGKPKSPRILQDAAPFSYLRPVVRVAATLIRAGTLDENTTATNAGYVGVVNDRPWMLRPMGCWLMSGYKSSTSKYAGTYSVRAEAIAKGDGQAPYEDWRVLDVLRSRQTGLIAVPDPEKITAALQATYKFGRIGSGYDPMTDGFIVHGPHHLDNFAALWSILIS